MAFLSYGRNCKGGGGFPLPGPDRVKDDLNFKRHCYFSTVNTLQLLFLDDIFNSSKLHHLRQGSLKV